LIVGGRHPTAKDGLLEHLFHPLSVDAEHIEHDASEGSRRTSVSAGVIEQSDEEMLGPDVLVL
jgi:hypothetical protein